MNDNRMLNFFDKLTDLPWLIVFVLKQYVIYF